MILYLSLTDVLACFGAFSLMVLGGSLGYWLHRKTEGDWRQKY